MWNNPDNKLTHLVSILKIFKKTIQNMSTEEAFHRPGPVNGTKTIPSVCQAAYHKRATHDLKYQSCIELNSKLDSKGN